MSLSKRTKSAPVGAATSNNPFDSSDDEAVPSSVRATYLNPFDDGDVDHPLHEATKLSTNPFDDKQKRHSLAHQPLSTNPFDDDEQPKRAVVTSNSLSASKVASSRRNDKDLTDGFRPGIGSTNPFHDEDLPSKSVSSRHESSSKESQSPPEKQANVSVNLKAHNSASLSCDSKGYQSNGEEACKHEAKTVKVDLTSRSPHSSVKEKLCSISDGVANRVHRLKQGSIGQFKNANSCDVNMNDSGKPKISGRGGSNARDLLLEGGRDHGEQKLVHQVGMQITSQYEQTHLGSSGLEGQNVQELENHALHKAEETTSTIYNCLKIAEDTKDIAIKTTIQLHEQGEQIQHIHNTAVEVDLELSKGEKLLGSLGGLFSKTWKPKKTRDISGPCIQSDSLRRKAYGLEQRTALGLIPGNVRGKSIQSNYASAEHSQSQAQILIEAEKSKQDDTLSDLSNVLGQLKDMTLDMGKEIERQNEDLNNLHNDITELGFRVKGANERGRRLLGR